MYPMWEGIVSTSADGGEVYKACQRIKTFARHNNVLRNYFVFTLFTKLDFARFSSLGDANFYRSAVHISLLFFICFSTRRQRGLVVNLTNRRQFRNLKNARTLIIIMLLR